MGYIRLEKDADGIVELIFDQPGKTVNIMGEEYSAAMKQAITDLGNMKDEITGIYIYSAKPGQFFAGGDITKMLETNLDMPVSEKAAMYNDIMAAKAPLRQLETLGVPVAVGLNGAALGGGFEIALACHRRFALKGIQVGLPEAQLGLMPGAGGIVRTTRLVGMQKAIALVSQGRRLKSEKALSEGLIDELCDTEDAMKQQAKAWIKANPEAQQPWDQKGFLLPGGLPDDAANKGMLMFAPANIMNKTKGLMPAQKVIFAAIVDTSRVDFDNAQKIEARYFLNLLLDQTARNMMTSLFLQMNNLKKGASRPEGFEATTVKTLGILGAGQMGAGIAFAAAKVGIKVFLKDINLDNANKGKDYTSTACEKNKRIDEQQAEQILSLINPTDNYQDLKNCDLVVEAVFEDRSIKASVTQELEQQLNEHAVIASNTSALPITELAEASERPANYIGMHFFSPAEKMPLVEIICGKQTSQEALVKAFDFAIQIGKTPIVVNDAPGFFTTRVIGTTIMQGAAMLLEGINPVLIDTAAKFNGSPMGPLSTVDEISQATAYKNGQQARADQEARGEKVEMQAASIIVEKMVTEFDRKGRRFGGGYYDYPENGKKTLWPGLKEHFAPDGYKDIPFQDIKDRLTFCQCIEAVRAMEEGVVTQVADGNIGSIMGIGFPAHTGGVFQFINAYGVREFANRSLELAKKYGDEFKPPQLLMDKAESNVQFI